MPSAPERSDSRTICFVAPKSYGMLSGRPDLTHAGGSEIQQVLIAQELVKRGHRVAFVTNDYGQPDGVEHDSIRVFKAARDRTGLPGVRFFHPRWTALASAMRRANADVYYQRAAGSETAQVAAWCRWHRRAFVYAVASDTDVDPTLPGLARRFEQRLFRYGLCAATRVIVQTERQRRALRDGYGLEAVLIRSCGTDPGRQAALAANPAERRPRLLWLGRLSPEKRPEWVLDLAERCTDLDFDLVSGTDVSDAYPRQLMARAAALSNVTLHGHVAHARISRLYRAAQVVLCTSRVEGFPNTFVEACAHALPTVSTVDPDGLIVANELGGVGRSVDELIAAVRMLLASADRWAACSARARRHFLGNHSAAAAGAAYESLFAGLPESIRANAKRTGVSKWTRMSAAPSLTGPPK